MKILKFDLEDAPEDATEYFSSLLKEAISLGFLTPNIDLSPNPDGSPVVSRDDVFGAMVDVYSETSFRGGPDYILHRKGSRCVMTDEEPSPDQKKKALRIKQRRAREGKG